MKFPHLTRHKQAWLAWVWWARATPTIYEPPTPAYGRGDPRGRSHPSCPLNKRPVPRIGLATRQAMIAYLFLLPALIYFTLFFAFPLISDFWTSLHDDQVPAQFLGLQNYLAALQDARVLNSFRVTVLFALGVTIFSILIGLSLALLLDQPLRGRVVLRAMLLVPYMSSAVIVGLMWRNILDPLAGILNRVLAQLALPPQDWLVNDHAALLAVIAITIWQSIGYTMLLFLAGLQGIPREYYEAARVDGASSLVRFRYVTLPLLAPTMLFVSILSVIGSLQGFAQAYIITQGGPADATRFYVFHVFNVAFNEGSIAYASALTFLLFIVILVLTIVQLRTGRYSIEY